jgi:hypothetical protein
MLIIAADSRTIHSEYVGKTIGPETIVGGQSLSGTFVMGSKRPSKSSRYVLPNF